DGIRDRTVTGVQTCALPIWRELGFPTANIVPDPSCRLKHGIYAVTMNVDGVTYGGVASFGRRPTFDHGAPLLEVYLFDFDGDLRSEERRVGKECSHRW